MHPATRFFNYLKRIDFRFALTREHIDDRGLTEWYPVWMYELMETDEVRNEPYRNVIQQVVPGKIVLELGTGRKALWAVECAEAGAKRVYAIEANKTAYESSVQFVEARGLENVHLIHGFSDKVELPERCEVLVHDLVGDIGSSEGMIPFIEDAKRRLLTPDAIHIPARCTTYVVLGEDPKLRLRERAFSYAMREFRRFDTLSFVRFFGFPSSATLSDPQVFEDIVFSQPPRLDATAQLDLEVKRDGELRGVVFFIRLFLNESRVVDTLASQTSWSTPYVRFAATTSVKKGDHVRVSIESHLSGNPSYSLTVVHNPAGSARVIGRYAWSGD